MSIDTFNQAHGRRVVASDTAETIGSVKGFVLDGGGRRIESIHVDGHGKRATVLEWSAVKAFGADAVMATSETDPTTIDDDHQRAAVKGDVTMIGTRVLLVDGREAGKVVDVEFDTVSGDVAKVITDHGSIEPGRVRSLGSYALVVDQAASASGS